MCNISSNRLFVYCIMFMKLITSNMNLDNLKHISIIFIGILIFSGCGGSNASRGTGWDINSKKGGFQYNIDFNEQETGPGLVFVEGGTFTKGQVQDDVMRDWNNSPTKQHVMSFYIDETEVTNIMYLEYLDWLEYVFPTEEARYRQIYEGALPDTLVWRNQLLSLIHISEPTRPY